MIERQTVEPDVAARNGMRSALATAAAASARCDSIATFGIALICRWWR